MSKYKLEVPFVSLRGKICSHAEIIFKQRKKTKYTSVICNPRDLQKKPYTANETATHTKFGQAIASAQAILADADQTAAYALQFDKQEKYTTLRGFIIAKEYEKLNV